MRELLCAPCLRGVELVPMSPFSSEAVSSPGVHPEWDIRIGPEVTTEESWGKGWGSSSLPRA